MSSLFADTRNVVAILEKSDAAEGFEQIIDFLSGSYIHYALTMNPHIYIWCIKQFGNTASIKRSDDVTRQLTEEGIAEEQVQADDDIAAAVQENVGENAAQKLEIIKLKARLKRLERANKVKSSKLRRLRKVGASKRIESSDDMEDVFNQGRMINDLDKDKGIELAEKQAEIYHLDLDHPSKVLNVVTAASQVSATSATIFVAKPSIPAAAPTVVAAYTRRRKGVIIRDPEEELSSKTPAETLKLKDKGKG
nr:hypothetical protein [Tanacetum cinerariifolium]